MGGRRRASTSDCSPLLVPPSTSMQSPPSGPVVSSWYVCVSRARARGCLFFLPISALSGDALASAFRIGRFLSRWCVYSLVRAERGAVLGGRSSDAYILNLAQSPMSSAAAVKRASHASEPHSICKLNPDLQSAQLTDAPKSRRAFDDGIARAVVDSLCGCGPLGFNVIAASTSWRQPHGRK